MGDGLLKLMGGRGWFPKQVENDRLRALPHPLLKVYRQGKLAAIMTLTSNCIFISTLSFDELIVLQPDPTR